MQTGERVTLKDYFAKHTRTHKNHKNTNFELLLSTVKFSYYSLGHCAQASIGFATHFWWMSDRRYSHNELPNFPPIIHKAPANFTQIIHK
jgi:hypothetical protein